MRRFRWAIVTLAVALPLLAGASLYALRIDDPARFSRAVRGAAEDDCAHRLELGRRYHRGPGSCAFYHCWAQTGPCCSTPEAGLLYQRFETDARAAGFDGRQREIAALFERWTDEEEHSAHDWPAEAIDDLRRHAGPFDRLRIALHRDRLASWYAEPPVRGHVDEHVPRDAAELRRLRILWSRHKLAGVAAILRKLAC